MDTCEWILFNFVNMNGLCSRVRVYVRCLSSDWNEVKLDLLALNLAHPRVMNEITRVQPLSNL